MKTTIQDQQSYNPDKSLLLLASIFWAGMIIYGSIIPFTFSFSQLSPDNIRIAPLRLDLQSINIEDIVTNFIMYVPLGVVLSALLKKIFNANSLHFILITVSMVIASMVSIVAEGLQLTIPVRVTSWTDFTVNMTGHFCGILLTPFFMNAVSRFVIKLQWKLRHELFNTLTLFLCCGILMFEFMPLNIRFHYFEPNTIWNNILYSVRQPVSCSNFFDDGLLAVWYGLLAYFSVLALQEISDKSHNHTGIQLFKLISFVIVIELCQLFMISHNFSFHQIWFRFVFVITGFILAMKQSKNLLPEEWNRTPAIVFPTKTAMILIVSSLCLITVENLSDSTFGLEARSLKLAVPFEKLWRGTMSHAAFQIFSRLMMYTILFTGAGLVFRRQGFVSPWTRIGVITISVMIISQSASFFLMYKTIDLTDLIIALCVLLVVSEMYNTLRPATNQTAR